MMVILIFYTRYQRRKHIQYLLETHHHLYDSTLNLTNNRLNDLKHSSRYNSSSIKYQSIQKVLPTAKQKIFASLNNKWKLVTTKVSRRKQITIEYKQNPCYY